MLSIAVELLHGTIRTGSPDDTVLASPEIDVDVDGAALAGEWPPSPARLFSALVAGDGTRERMTGTSGAELLWLERLDPPVIHASPSGAVQQSVLLPRFVVVDKIPDRTAGSDNTFAVQDYPVRTSTQVRRGVRLSPREQTVTYLWPTAEPTAEHLASLRYRAARVGYLGCSDSPVRITVGQGVPVDVPEPWVPDPSAAASLPIPYPGFLDALDQAYDAWSAGQAMRRSWIPTRRTRYRAPGIHDEVVSANRTGVWLRFDRSVSGRHLLLLTSTLRAAVTDHLQRLLGAPEVPSVVHGHRPDGTHGAQIDFVALPDAGYRHSSGRLFGAAISLPSGTDPQLIQHIRAAVFRLSAEGLVAPHQLSVKMSVHGGEPKPWAANPRRWAGPSRHWVTVTPVVHERWSRGGPDRREVGEWCAHAGIVADGVDDLVTSVSVSRRPMVPGALDLPPTLMFRDGRERRPYSHMQLMFARPVAGPVVLGRSRQLGFGLFAPVADEEGCPDARIP